MQQLIETLHTNLTGHICNYTELSSEAQFQNITPSAYLTFAIGLTNKSSAHQVMFNEFLDALQNVTEEEMKTLPTEKLAIVYPLLRIMAEYGSEKYDEIPAFNVTIATLVQNKMHLFDKHFDSIDVFDSELTKLNEQAIVVQMNAVQDFKEVVPQSLYSLGVSNDSSNSTLRLLQKMNEYFIQTFISRSFSNELSGAQSLKNHTAELINDNQLNEEITKSLAKIRLANTPIGIIQDIQEKLKKPSSINELQEMFTKLQKTIQNSDCNQRLKDWVGNVSTNSIQNQNKLQRFIERILEIFENIFANNSELNKQLKLLKAAYESASKSMSTRSANIDNQQM